ARAFAIVHIAMFDAFNAIVGGFESFTGLDPDSCDEDFDFDRRRASVDAAIAQAAGDTLMALFPSQADDIEAIQRADLRTIRNGRAKNAGVRIGSMASNKISSARTADGSQDPEPLYHVPGSYIPNPALGKWRQDLISLTPIALGAFWARDQNGQLRKGQPFFIPSADQF